MSTSLLILGDQLVDDHPGTDRDDVERVVMVEASDLVRARPYHRKKLVLLLSAMRHFARGLEHRGRSVDYRQSSNLEAGVQEHLSVFAVDRLLIMEPDSYWFRRRVSSWPKLFGIAVETLINVKMVNTRTEFTATIASASLRTQEDFYRMMRRQTGLLMENDLSPVGGRWNFDASNRKRLPKSGIDIPDPVGFEPDAITRQVIEEVEQFEGLIGSAADFNLAVDSVQAKEATADFIENRLPFFGRYEDAMTTKSDTVFHSGLSASMNLGLLDPLEVCRQVGSAFETGTVPIESAEGFIRQVIGWREYMHHQYANLMPELANSNSWEHGRPLPGFWWSGETDMACLGSVIKKVIRTGYSHHIERLMILTSFAFMAELDPGEVNEWFRSIYIDAYDWVVTPNVIGMGLNADGGSIATKPYFSSANYINRMSDYCGSCRFDPKKRTGSDSCPFNQLFWRKVSRERQRLSGNFRSRMMVRQLDKMDPSERAEIIRSADTWLEAEI